MYYSGEEKGKWLEEWKASGKGAWAFAKEKGLKQQTFAKWVKKEKEGKGGFVEITAQNKPSVQNASGILIEKGDMKILIPLTTNADELRAIFKALGIVQ